MLYSWKRQYLSELGSGAPSGAPDPNAMADEIARLRKELAQTKVMNEILKKLWATSAKSIEPVRIHSRQQ